MLFKRKVYACQVDGDDTKQEEDEGTGTKPPP